jgi:hypothetical protein
MNWKIIAAVAIVAVISLDGSEAHLTEFCTSTSPKAPGRIDFYFGTYHAAAYKARPKGQVDLVNTGGTKARGYFNDIKQVPRNEYMITTPEKSEALVKKLFTDMPKGSTVTCYTGRGAAKTRTNQAPPKGGGQWIMPAPRGAKQGVMNNGRAATNNNQGFTPSIKAQHGGWNCYSLSRGFARVTVPKATSGDWKLTTQGTDMNFAPIGVGWDLCAMSNKNPKWIGGMSVAAPGPAAKGTPKVPKSIDANSVKNCPKFSGAVCSTAKCAKGMFKGTPKLTGNIMVKNGKWVSTVKCTGKPIRVISKCENVATKELQTITQSVATQQAILDGQASGCACANMGQASVVTARRNHASSVTRHNAAVTAHNNAKNAMVNIPSQKISQLKAGKCGFAFSSGAYRNANNAHTNAQNHRNTRHTQMTSYKKAYDTAVKAAAKAVRKCQCQARHTYRQAWIAATTATKQNAHNWMRTQHLLCVHRGSIKLHGNGNTLGKCSHAKCPAVKKKKLCAAIEKLKEPDCVKGKHYEEDMEIEEAASILETELIQDDSVQRAPEGFHTMPNGEIMADSEM